MQCKEFEVEARTALSLVEVINILCAEVVMYDKKRLSTKINGIFFESLLVAVLHLR